jgi:hypothetical protein
MKKLQAFTPEPVSKSNKRTLIENMSKTIVKFSKAVYNQPLTPKYIDYLEKINLREEGFQEERKKTSNLKLGKKLGSGRKFTFDGVQILNLPRLPYGKHSNYEEPNFIRKHFVDLNLTHADFDEIKNFDRQFRLQKKNARKEKKQSMYSTNYTNNLKQYLIIKSDAGELKCKLNESISKEYDKQKRKFRVLSVSENLETKPKSISPKNRRNLRVSVDDIEKILTEEGKGFELNRKKLL